MAAAHQPAGEVLLARPNVRLAAGAIVSATDEPWRLCCVEPASRVSTAVECVWTLVPQRLLTALPPDDARYRIARELVETEEAYGNAMALLADTLLAPLQRPGVGVLPGPLLAKIFSSTPRIAAVSRALSGAMRLRLAPHAYVAERAPLGATLLRCVRAHGGLLGGSAFADAHVQYINNFEQSQRALEAAGRQFPEWTAFVRHWHLLLPACGHGDAQLADLMIRPVQRIPRLRLLLEQLVGATPAHHPDRPATEQALSLIHI